MDYIWKFHTIINIIIYYIIINSAHQSFSGKYSILLQVEKM